MSRRQPILHRVDMEDRMAVLNALRHETSDSIPTYAGGQEEVGVH